ncbi:MAG: IS630 family transposase [Candidatus Micrarchaeia archaeon]
MEDSIIVFIDQISPQTTSNSIRFWSFNKPEISRNTDRYKANVFGFYSLNGAKVVDFPENSKKKSIISFLKKSRERNQYKKMVIILDNFKPHHCTETIEPAKNLNINLVFLPPYSPDLNPIDFIWKDIRRKISKTFIESIDRMKELINENYLNSAQ